MKAVQFLTGSRRARGFAIPAAVFVIVVVSLLALGGLYIAQSNASASTGIKRSWKAFYAANAGAARTLAKWDRHTYAEMVPGENLDSNWQTLPDGSQYRASVMRVDDGSDPTELLYRLRAVGRPGRGVSAQRIVVRMVRAVRADALCCEGAMKTQGRLRIQGTGLGAKVSGTDIPPPIWAGQCTTPQADLPGIMIQEDEEIDINGLPILEGTPPILEDATINDSDFTQFGELSYDDLAAAADHRFVGDQTFAQIAPVSSGGTCDTSVPTNWGDPTNPGAPCWDYGPIIHVAGDALVSGNGVGQGIVLIDGDFIVTGDFDFAGIIVVMGEADLRGITNLNGALLARNGITGTGTSFLRGGTTIQYSSCSAARALAHATVAQPLAGRSWFEALE